MATTARHHREAMVYAAAQRLRRSGLAGVALREVAADAGAPRGSIQHYFPGGKDQLVRESLAWSGAFAAGRVADDLARARHPTPARLFADLVGHWVRELTDRGFDRGCPVAATVVDAAGTSDPLRTAAADALATWRRPLVDGLVAAGVPRRRAGSLATLMLAALEGALVLARAQRSAEPLRVVERELRPLLDDARRPGVSGPRRAR